jgi:hypothetical protein
MNIGILLGREAPCMENKSKGLGRNTIWCVNEQMVLTFLIVLTQRAVVYSRKRGTAKKHHNNINIMYRLRGKEVIKEI